MKINSRARKGAVFIGEERCSAEIYCADRVTQVDFLRRGNFDERSGSDAEETSDTGENHLDRDGSENHAHQSLDGDEATPFDEAGQRR